jgi:membrane protease YdiL (CAAX protease family)
VPAQSDQPDQSDPPGSSHPASRAGSSVSPRPWWARIAAAFVLACVIWLLVQAIATGVFGPDYSYGSHILRAILTCLIVLVSLAVLLRWDRTRASNYGIGRDAGMLRGIAIGAVSYLLPLLLAATVVLLFNLARIEVTGNGLQIVGEGLAILVLVLLYEAIPEELIFRGYLFRVLAERLPGWATVLAQALLFCAFGAAIGAATNIDRLLLFFFFSISLGYLRQVTGTVFATIGFHAVFQLFSQWLLGEQWPALSLVDPNEWFALAALGLAPFLLAPVVAAVIVRSGRHSSRATA